MAFRKNKNPDIMLKKQAQLNQYMAQYDSAVSLVTNTIDNLGEISRGIEDTIREIDDYQKGLDATRAGLSEAKAKNDKVIANFRALLGDE